MPHLLIISLLLCLCACSAKTDTEQGREDLSHTRGEWTHAQTDKAIDIYLETLAQEEDLLNRNIELRRTLRYFDENRCSRQVLNARRHEIDSVRTRLKARRDTLAAISR